MLALDVTWLSSAYEATVSGTAEWPPHPARAFCALVSVAEPGSADDEALRWLEALPPPVVEAPPASSAQRQAFVPTNALEAKDTHQTYVGRTSGSRSWARSVPARPVARFVWPAANPPQDLLGRLDGLARRVPYFGRSTSPAILAFSDTPSPRKAVHTYEPDPTGHERLRAPHPGYLAQLRAAFHDRSELPTVPATRYRAAHEERRVKAAPPAPPPWPDFVTLGFEPGQSVDGRHARVVADAFKAALLSRLGKPRPPTDDWLPLSPDDLAPLHGHYDHKADDRRQCAMVALPFVGHEHADGHLVGVGLALSPHLERGALRPVLRLLGFDRDVDDEGPRLASVRLPGGQRLALARADRRWGLDPTRWSEPAQRWDTVYPIVVDRFPRRRYGLAEAVADGCEFAGFDRPEHVEVHAASVVAGAPYVAMGRRAPGDPPRRPLVHASLHFSRPIRGPVLVGHLRHVGLGLCAPRREGPS